MNQPEKNQLAEIKNLIESMIGPVTIEIPVKEEDIPEGMMDADIFLNLLEYNLKQGKMDDHALVNLLRHTLPIVHFERSGKNKKGKL